MGRNIFFKKNLIIIIGLVIICVLLPLAIFDKSDKTIGKRSAPETENMFLLGEYYFNHGPDADGTYDLSLARHYYEQALTDNPLGDNWGWYQLGRIDFLEGKFDAAIFKFNKQVEYFADQQPSVYYMLGLTYGYRARREGREEDWVKAEEYFLRYLEHDNDSPWARVDLAWVYFAQGKFEEMKPVLKFGLETNSDNPWLLNMYGLALLNTGDKENAGNNFSLALEKAHELTPEDWGMSYPGNDPTAWSEGLREFRSAIEANLNLTRS